MDLKNETNKWKERSSVFIRHKIINSLSGSENPQIVSSILEYHDQSIERLWGDRTEFLRILGYWDQMVSVKGCTLGKGSVPTGATSNPSRRLLGHIPDSPIPMFLSLMDSLVALRNFTSTTYNGSSPGSRFEVMHCEKGFQSLTFFSELCLSFSILLVRNWIYVTYSRYQSLRYGQNN